MNLAARSRAWLVAASLVAAAGCNIQGLNFRVDERVHIVTPKARTTVPLPVTLSWTVHDFSTGYFGIFVDTAPPPPDKPLAWLARNDRECLPTAGCPNADYFAAHGVYTTTRTSFVLQQIRPPLHVHGKEFHTVTIILLDHAGHRIGESAWSVRFAVDRPV